MLIPMTARTIYLTAISMRSITKEWTIIARTIKGFVFHWHYLKYM